MLKLRKNLLLLCCAILSIHASAGEISTRISENEAGLYPLGKANFVAVSNNLEIWAFDDEKEIYLESEGAPIQFRNLRIRELP